MAPDVSPHVERILDDFVPVQPASIEAEFAKLWDDPGAQAYDASSVRLRLSTIIAWGATQPDARERFELAMEALAVAHPCRGILAISAEQQSPLESAISARCWRTAAGARHACTEEILLRSRPDALQAVASAILALLVPDVPVCLWELADPATTRVPDDLVEAADMLLFDSGLLLEPVAQVTSAVGMRSRPGVRLIDLSWVRDRIWRELAAQMFDGNEPQLDQVREISVVGGRERVTASALLTAGWLASNLGLASAQTSIEPNRVSATCYDGVRSVRLSIEAHGGAHDLTAIRIAARDTFTVELHDDGGHIHVRSDGAAVPTHRVVAPDESSGPEVLVAALNGPADQRSYMRAVDAITAILNA